MIGTVAAIIGIFLAGLAFVLALAGFWMTHIVNKQGSNLGNRIDVQGNRIDDLGTNLGKRIDDQGTNLCSRIDLQTQATEKVIMAHVEADRKRADNLETLIEAQGTKIEAQGTTLAEIKGLLSPRPWDKPATPESNPPSTENPPAASR